MTAGATAPIAALHIGDAPRRYAAMADATATNAYAFSLTAEG